MGQTERVVPTAFDVVGKPAQTLRQLSRREVVELVVVVHLRDDQTGWGHDFSKSRRLLGELSPIHISETMENRADASGQFLGTTVTLTT